MGRETLDDRVRRPAATGDPGEQHPARADRPDHDLLEAWRGGDRAAGDLLIDRHFPALFGFFGRRCGDTEVEDLVQESLFECVRSAPNQRSSSFRAFLFGVAHNVLRRHYERLTRRRARDGGGVSSLVQDSSVRSPSSHVWHGQESKLLLQALRSLSIDDQLLLEWTYWEELRSGEIAEILGIPAGTVRTRQLHARRRLRAAIKRLATSPALAAATLGSLDTWIAEMRDASAGGGGSD